MDNRRNADAGPSQERRAIKSGVRKTVPVGVQLRPGHATKSVPSNPRPRDGEQPLARQPAEDVRRTTLRKTAEPPPQSQSARPKSTFSYIAPLLRTRGLPTKEGPLLPSAHIAEDRREREKRREQDEYALGPTRSAPRTSLPSMSVQRRVTQSPRKKQQSPLSRRTPVMISARGPISLNSIPKPRAHLGRGGKLVYGNSDSDEESSSSGESVQMQRKTLSRPSRAASSTSGGRAPRQILSAKAARKTNISEEPTGPVARLTKAAKKFRVSVDNDFDSEDGRTGLHGENLVRRPHTSASDQEDAIIVSDSDSDVGELLRALDELVLSEARMQKLQRLPFLLRNLRKGYIYQCQRHGIRVTPPNAPRGAVKVVFKYYLEANDSGASSDSGSDARESQTYVGSIADWRCPMCQLHKPFDTREMLIFHLVRDHSEVKASWREITVRKEQRWRLDLVIPDIKQLEESSSDEDDIEDKGPVDVPQQQEDDMPVDTEVEPEAPGTLRLPLFLPRRDSESRSPTTPPAFLTEDIEEKKMFRSSTSPTPAANAIKQRHSPTPATRGRPSLPGKAVQTSYRGSLPARYPSPPPPHDKLGPAAQYPYLPGRGEDGQEMYSCRIGGPRLFDLVSMLPTEEFGVMAWAIVDREEELFEMEDVRDEDKVMLALWNRWIMIHRSWFIFNDYFEGVKRFVDKYWRVIHQAAGWRALRAFLMTLSVNKFLTFDKVLKTLKFYEELTGMALWYQDDTDA